MSSIYRARVRVVPEHVRSENGPEFVAKALWARIAGLRRKDRLHRDGSALKERCMESFNAWLRDEPMSGEVFYSLQEAQIVIESWRRHYKLYDTTDNWLSTTAISVSALAAWSPVDSRSHLGAEYGAERTLHLGHAIEAGQGEMHQLCVC